MNLRPRFLVAFQTVLEEALVRGGKIEAGEINLQTLFTGGNGE